MQSFSQRKGLKPIKSIMQVDSMDDDLRNGLWNALYIYYFDDLLKTTSGYQLSSTQDAYALSISIYCGYFKSTFDKIPNAFHRVVDDIRNRFFTWTWYEVYDFVEFVVNNHEDKRLNATFMETCNGMLERELSAYRFVNGIITQLTSEEEIAEIEQAIHVLAPLKPVSTHLKTALDLLSDKQKPDYRNSIKESISAVESLCNLITGSKDTLGEALRKVEATVAIHPALKKGFSSIYGYTNDASGIRHALLDEHNLAFEDAKYMLVSCSAFINYLISKAAKAGITF